MSALRLAGAAVGVVIVGSLLGGSRLVGIPALFLLLVAVLVLAIRGGRPTVGGSPHKARSLGFIARYLVPKQGLAGIVLGAFAGLAVLAWRFPTAPVEQLAGCYLVVFGLYLLPPDWTDLAVGGAGIVATGVALRGGDVCTPPLREEDQVWLVGLLVVVAGVFLATRLGVVGLARLLPDRIPPARQVLVVFGVLAAALFVVRPNGLEIWDGAPPLARLGALALVALLALLGSYGRDFVVLGPLAAALAVGQAVLVVVQLRLVAGQPVPTPAGCRDPVADAAWMVGFVVVACAAVAVRGGSR